MTQLQGSTAKPKPRPVPAPGPRPVIAKVRPIDNDSQAYESAKDFGRVDESGAVWVKDNGTERQIGQFPDEIPADPLNLYIRRYLEISSQIELFAARLEILGGKEIDESIKSLAQQVESPNAVGDLAHLRTRVSQLREAGEARKEVIREERAAARKKAVEDREEIVVTAENISNQDQERTQWKVAGEQLRELFEKWKHLQRTGPRLDRNLENELWQRFSAARSTFEKNRRNFFNQLDASHAEAKRVKEKLIAEAEKLSSSTNWGETAAVYRDLMKKWRQAGRANRREDDELWQRFYAAQQVFFDARQAQNEIDDAEQKENLTAKLALLEKAEALLPVTDIDEMKAKLRPLQEKWDQIGRVPRNDLDHVEGRMRAVEDALREAEEQAWKKSNPETKARAEGMAGQLQALIEELEEELAEAKTSGNEAKVKELEESLEARKAWLSQVTNF